MKASELMLNNYVKDNKGTISTINELRVMNVELRNDIDYVDCDYEDLQPIELTEEILLKCGFVRYDGWDDQNYWCLPDEQGLVNRFELIIKTHLL